MLITENVRKILRITNAHSHTESLEKEESKLQLDDYRETVRSPYLLYGLTLLLMDVLLWFKEYVDANDDVEVNRSHWTSIVLAEEVTGIVINKSFKGFAS